VFVLTRSPLAHSCKQPYAAGIFLRIDLAEQEPIEWREALAPLFVLSHLRLHP
jgi:hypothetical protein